ncbi:FliM/FliN family flagellar motor switch protein [Paracoccus sp. p4-l81]|uniref:FliM/FliN family flagellar motor switch protein n=1 Tax=unclassified Paracoccus (in: a-proteobacteria) TaxID=2688777 RepID=UPI0035B8E658
MTTETGQPANPFLMVPVEITISVGRARPTLRDLLAMGRDAILALDRKVDDPVDLFIGDKLIARGELTEMDGESTGMLGVRLTEVINTQATL